MPKNYTKEELENGRWITVKGAHVFLKDGESVDDAMKRIKAAMNDNTSKKPSVHKKQAEWENKYRNAEVEHGAYFDKDGNILFEEVGTAEGLYNVRYLAEKYPDNEEYWDKVLEYNNNVEQRVWHDEELNYTHNHPINTIFSPQDFETFEILENHSMRAVLPDGTNYMMIRKQPRTSNEWIYDESKGEMIRKFEALKIGPDYSKEYDKIWDKGWERIKETTQWGTTERAQAEAELDAEIREKMEAWLIKNAHKYGYEFRRE